MDEADEDGHLDEENDTSCCYALQNKVWVTGPGKEPWEVYVVKADADTLGKSVDAAPQGKGAIDAAPRGCRTGTEETVAADCACGS